MEEEPIAEGQEIEIDETAAMFMDLYEREEALYYEATAKIINISDATIEEKQVIASTASENYLKAESLTLEIKNVDKSFLADKEKEV